MKQKAISIKKSNIKAEILAVVNAINNHSGNRVLTDYEKGLIKHTLSSYIKNAYKSTFLCHSMHLDFEQTFLTNYNTLLFKERLNEIITFIDQTETKSKRELDQLVDKIQINISEMKL